MLNGFKLRKIYHVGYCIGRGSLSQKSQGWDKMRYHARVFLLEHPEKGLVLIDTGYGKAFLKEIKKGFGFLYNLMLKVIYDPKRSLLQQLKEDGIEKKDLSYLIITHFHPDHIGALSEFSDVPWIYREDVLKKCMRLSSLSAFKNGFFRKLVPAVPQKSICVSEQDFSGSLFGFGSYDVFGDSSLFLIDLPGHSLGQMGVMIKDLFFIADAAWSLIDLPNKIGLFAQENSKIYRKIYRKIINLPKTIQKIPTHIMERHEK